MTRYVIKTKPTTLTSDSREVKDNTLFVAYPGDQADGRDYIQDAIDKGASAILWDPAGFDWHAEWQVENMPISNLKRQASRIGDQFYNSPSSKLWTIGITGTNGKTSVSQWLAQCFNTLQRKTAVMGTLGNGFPGQLVPAVNTTSDALLLQQSMADYVRQDAEAVVMEVSSHGLSQGRVNGVHFDVAILTNLSRDHLDYHGSYEKYAEVKKRLFGMEGLKHAILNADDDLGKTLCQELSLMGLGVNVMTYGIQTGDVHASKIRFDNGQIHFFATTPYGQADVTANLIGRFNVYNVLAVLAGLLASDVSLTDAVDAISKIEPLGGRMQQFGGGHLPQVVVDYAHTPDSLKNVLSTLRELTQGKLICVFGCGGDRDQGKRAMMGEVASALADGVVVTTDNPRNEKPEAIMRDILDGVQGQYALEEDRAKAISIAVANAQAGDVVLIAGKGHEDYQEVAGERHYFSDVDQVAKALKHYEAVSV